MIAVSDLHLRSTVPRCRAETKEEWMEHQYNRLMEMISYANRHSMDIYIAGDTFHYAVNSEDTLRLFVRAFSELKYTVYIMAGNHCLLYRQQDSGKSTFDIVKDMAKLSSHIVVEEGFCFVPYGSDKIHRSIGNALFMHTLTFEKDEHVPYGVTHYETGKSLLDKYTDWNTIIVGDQHRAFKYVENGRTVVNCGCMTPQSVTEKDYPCGFWVYDKSKSDWFQILYQTPAKFVDDSVLQQEIKRESQVVDMMKKLADYEGKSIDFEESLRNELTASNQTGSINGIVIRWIQEAQNEQ
jgi:hypothetical protein